MGEVETENGKEKVVEVILTKDEKILALLLFLFMIGTSGAEVTHLYD